ncbi:MAG: hypothetical protein IJ017_01290 [Oscillospiraceae bacterium]|nr:hypothetical protein [Oscillospiraceae bacterium]
MPRVIDVDEMKAFIKDAEKFRDALAERQKNIENAKNVLDWGAGADGEMAKRGIAWLQGAETQMQKAIDDAEEMIELLQDDLNKALGV